MAFRCWTESGPLYMVTGSVFSIQFVILSRKQNIVNCNLARYNSQHYRILGISWIVYSSIISNPTQCMKMRGSRNFRQGGTGQVGKKALTTFSFSPQLIAYFTEDKWLISKKTIIFHGSRGDPTFSRAGPTFSNGVQLLIPYKYPYNL